MVMERDPDRANKEIKELKVSHLELEKAHERLKNRVGTLIHLIETLQDRQIHNLNQRVEQLETTFHSRPKIQNLELPHSLVNLPPSETISSLPSMKSSPGSPLAGWWYSLTHRQDRARPSSQKSSDD